MTYSLATIAAAAFAGSVTLGARAAELPAVEWQLSGSAFLSGRGPAAFASPKGPVDGPA